MDLDAIILRDDVLKVMPYGFGYEQQDCVRPNNAVLRFNAGHHLLHAIMVAQQNAYFNLEPSNYNRRVVLGPYSLQHVDFEAYRKHHEGGTRYLKMMQPGDTWPFYACDGTQHIDAMQCVLSTA